MAPGSRRRSTLFVGALALDALPAAFASGADQVCVDLEDAVPPGRKDAGRAAALAGLAGLPADAARPALVARVNPLATAEGLEDIEALAASRGPLSTLMLPKVESADEIVEAARRIERHGASLELFAIIETPPGLERAPAIAAAHPRLKALFFGGFDLSTALGCEMDWEPLLYARSRVVHAAACGGIECIDSPYPGQDDPEGLAQACRRARALGMTGKAAKSAAQVAAINAAFTPSAEERARARRIVDAFDVDPTRPLFFEGRLYELPTIKRLRRIASDPVP